MKKLLKKQNDELLYFYENDVKKIVNITDKNTYPKGITGTINSGLRGNISGLRGDATGIVGNLDDCEITEEERKKGINIEDLVEDSE